MLAAAAPTALLLIVALAPADAQPSAGASGASGNLTPEAAARAPVMPDFVNLARAAKPAVVSVRVRADVTPDVTSGDGGLNPFDGTPFERFFRDLPGGSSPFERPRRRFTQAQGSGFFISGDGYIVTNNHVVANATKVDVVMDDATQLEANVVGSDRKTDLALLKVEGRNNFPFVEFAETPPQVGEWVVAMGNPFGLGGTVTAGIVSAHGRDIGQGPYDDFLQIDAAVNRGNSGGPTFNMNGRVIGVNTAIYSPSGGSVGIAFSVPASLAKRVVAELKQRGFVERGWLGVRVQAVTPPIAESLGLQQPRGALVAGTENGSPAAASGLQAGDVITSINGQEVKDSRDLARQVAGLSPGATASIGYVRDGSARTVNVTIAQLQDQSPRRRAGAAPQDDQTGRLGLTVAPASEVEGAGGSGLAVLQVDPGGKAAELGFAPGDVIIRVGRRPVRSIDDFNEAMQAARAAGRDNVLVMVRRGESQRFVAVPSAVG